MSREKQYLTPTEVANLLMVSAVAVRKWAQGGELKALTTPGGHRRFLMRDVQEFAKKRGINLLSPEQTQGRKILIVDDDKLLCEYLQDLFTQHDEAIDVHAVHDGFSAGSIIKELMPTAILLDLKMPGMDGFQVCRMIKDDPLTGIIRVVTMTGHYTKTNVQKALDAGADHCLKKPFEDQALFDVIGL